MTLSIPFLSQNGPGADERRNDCGAACCAMIIRGLTEQTPTVDEIAIAYQPQPNYYMAVTDLLAALRGYGVPANYRRPLYASDIEWNIRLGKPTIALVKYSKLPIQATPFTGSHFIVCYGLEDGRILYHDPLFLHDTGTIISKDDLNLAMSGFEPGENMYFQGIIAG